MVTVEINVTKKDINEGICQSSSNCPIARAVLRAGFDRVDVDGDGLGFGLGKKDEDGLYYNPAAVALPEQAKNFIEAFDSKEPVKPFKFRIKLKNSVAKQLKLRKSAIVASA